jgi:hypothetical protein
MYDGIKHGFGVIPLSTLLKKILKMFVTFVHVCVGTCMGGSYIHTGINYLKFHRKCYYQHHFSIWSMKSIDKTISVHINNLSYKEAL